MSNLVAITALLAALWALAQARQSARTARATLATMVELADLVEAVAAASEVSPVLSPPLVASSQPAWPTAPAPRQSADDSRPTCRRDELLAQVRDLCHQGRAPRDISRTLGLSLREIELAQAISPNASRRAAK